MEEKTTTKDTEKQNKNSTHNILEEKKEKQKKAEWLFPWHYKKGQSGNPGGRPKGKSMKQYAKELLECQTDEERQEFLNGLSKDIIWKMAEGNPQTDITSGGEKINPIPIINVISTNISDNENTETAKEIENNTGGNISEQNNLNPPILDSNGTVRQATDTDEHSVGELSTSEEGSGEGLPTNNEGTPVL